MKLVKTKELFTLDFVKTVFIKTFINRRYEREGYIHVWKDDHIEGGKIFDLIRSLNCEIIKEIDYLLYRPKGGEKLYRKFEQKCSDTKYVFIRKLKEKKH